MIAKKFDINFGDLLEANRKRYPDLVGHSKLMEGTKVSLVRSKKKYHILNDQTTYLSLFVIFPCDRFKSRASTLMKGTRSPTAIGRSQILIMMTMIQAT